MSRLDHVVILAQAYGESMGLGNTTVSWRVFGDSKKLAAIVGGADLQVTRYERALQWFSDHWPATLTWPQDIPRPAPDGVASRGVEEPGRAFVVLAEQASILPGSQDLRRPLSIHPPLARTEEERQAALQALLDTARTGRWNSEGRSWARDDAHDRDNDRY